MLMQQAVRQFAEQHPPLLALITVQQAEQILPVAEALQAGGITALEITLRTAAGEAAIALAKRHFPSLCVCAGTVTRPEQLTALADSGTDFVISPGLSPTLLESAQRLQLDLLPGVMTPTDIMQGLEWGLDFYKFFPAGAANGIDMLKALAGPFASLRFCPTGNIRPENLNDFLSLSNVFACGGSWLVQAQDIAEQNWKAIERKARETVQRMNSTDSRPG